MAVADTTAEAAMVRFFSWSMGLRVDVK